MVINHGKFNPVERERERSEKHNKRCLINTSVFSTDILHGVKNIH